MTNLARAGNTQIVPTLFGTGARQLFGIYHAPDGAVVRDAGVVLCHPAPQDYSQTYWAMHKLASMLAGAGFHVLRFDYSGTGDSSGSAAEVTLGVWQDDILAAVAELQDMSGARRVSLAGMRLGAALAMRAATTGARIRDLVLWEPVVSGTAYLNELDSVERRRLQLLNYPEPDDLLDDELMGYAFPTSLRQETSAVDLCSEPLCAVDRMLLISARGAPFQGALMERASGDGLPVTSLQVSDPVLYQGSGHPSESLLAHNIPAAITSFLAEGAE